MLAIINYVPHQVYANAARMRSKSARRWLHKLRPNLPREQQAGWFLVPVYGLPDYRIREGVNHAPTRAAGLRQRKPPTRVAGLAQP